MLLDVPERLLRDPKPPPPPSPTTAVGGDKHGEEIALDAATCTIVVDGDSSDWDGIEGATVTLEQFELPPADVLQYTIDARSRAQWAYFDFSSGATVAAEQDGLD